MKDDTMITVIITSHNRKEFLIQAVNSVLNQNLIDEKCEIIVVKNFIDSQIDIFLHDNNVLTLFSDSSDLGSKIEYSLKYVNGEIIYFLDDDDTFEPDKIHIITNFFLKNPELYYVHNNQNLMNDKGIILIDKRTNCKTNDFNILDLNEASKQGIIRIILKKKLTFNLSSISIRKESLPEFKNLLSVVTLRTDFASLVSIIEDNKKLIGYTNFPFTNYRIHETNLSKLRLENKNSFMFLLNSINNLLLIKNYSKNTIIKLLCDYFINDAWIKLNFFYGNLRKPKDYEISLKKLLEEVFITHRLQNISLYLVLKVLKQRQSIYSFAIKIYRFFQ